MADQENVSRVVYSSPHSVELTTNSKGKVTAVVKVYADSPMNAAREALATLEYVKSQLGADAAGE